MPRSSKHDYGSTFRSLTLERYVHRPSRANPYTTVAPIILNMVVLQTGNTVALIVKEIAASLPLWPCPSGPILQLDATYYVAGRCTMESIESR